MSSWRQVVWLRGAYLYVQFLTMGVSIKSRIPVGSNEDPQGEWKRFMEMM